MRPSAASGSIFFYQNWLIFLLALWLSFLLTNASKVFSETISDYSKLIDMNVSTFGPLLDSLPYKNASDEPKSDEKRDDSFNDIKQDDSVDKDDTNS